MILITRPYGDGVELSKKLSHHYGLESIILPVIDIKKRAFTLPVIESNKSNKKSICVLTSKNAVASLWAQFGECQKLLDSHCICVGAKTAEAAKNLGFKDVIHVDGTMDDIIRYLSMMDLSAFGQLFHLTSPHGRLCAQMPGDIKARLSLHNVICYDVIPSQELSQTITRNLYSININQFIFFSALSAKIFLSYVRDHTYSAYAKPIACICMSHHVAEIARSFEQKNVFVADKPTINAMIQKIIEVDLCQKNHHQ